MMSWRTNGHVVRRFALVASATLPLACGSESPAAPIEPPGSKPYVAGQSYLGRNGYIEYLAGNAPVILTVPHGGGLNPSSIPDRTDARCGGSATTATDLNTDELVLAMRKKYFDRFGKYPHVIIAHLSRRKLDANRVGIEATCGNADALSAFTEWQQFIDAAKLAVLTASQKGWYMDMHGHGHTVQRLEFGYLLTSTALNGTDAAVDANQSLEQRVSVRTISEQSPLTLSALLRGPASLGTLYATNGFPSVPSAPDPRPLDQPYFDGGDNTRRYTCGEEAGALGGVPAGPICGVQVEANFIGVRDTTANRDRFAEITAQVLEQYLLLHWGLRLAP